MIRLNQVGATLSPGSEIPWLTDWLTDWMNEWMNERMNGYNYFQKKNQNTIMVRQRHRQTDRRTTYHSVNAQYRSLCGKKNKYVRHTIRYDRESNVDWKADNLLSLV